MVDGLTGFGLVKSIYQICRISLVIVQIAEVLFPFVGGVSHQTGRLR